MNKVFVKRITSIWMVVSIIAVGSLMYVLGRLDGKEGLEANIVISYPEEMAVRRSENSAVESSTSESASLSSSERIVASKNGERFYTPGCSGIDRILPENRIYFSSQEEAEASGRSLAKACQ
jgi:hypothetical protein